MKLAFHNQAKYPDFKPGYELYCKRSKKGQSVDEKTYHRIIRRYCNILADRLEREGMADLPNKMGTIAAILINRKPQFRGDKYIGYGKMNWETGQLDGSYKAFGIAYMPRRDKNANLRCFGFVANRQLFKRMKALFEGYDCPWTPLELTDEMI